MSLIKHSMLVVFLSTIILMVGCATMGPAPAKLSAEVGDRISEMQGLHQLTLDSYFESERKRIETFLEERWIPLFLKNFLGTSGLMNNLKAVAFVSEVDREALNIALKEYLLDDEEAGKATQEIVDSVSGVRKQETEKVGEILGDYIEEDKLDTATIHISSLLQAADPAFLIIEWVSDAQTVIDRQRKELLQPLKEAERSVTSELSQAYAEMLKANGVVTARLEAAAKIKEYQDSFLQSFRAKQHADLLRQRLGEISGIVGKAIVTADSILNNPVAEETTSQTTTKAIKALKDKLQDITYSNNQ